MTLTTQQLQKLKQGASGSTDDEEKGFYVQDGKAGVRFSVPIFMGGSGDLDFYSTGFKLRDTDGMHNWTDYKYVYAAFADHPIVGTNGTVGLAF